MSQISGSSTSVFTRRLSDVPAAVEQLLASQGRAPGSYEVVFEPQPPEDVSERLAQAQSLREQSVAAADESTELTRQVVVELHDRGLSLRDIGTLLGVSHQRAQQIASLPAPEPTPKSRRARAKAANR